MKLIALEFVVLLSIIICSALLVAGCSHTPVSSEKHCCKRLDVRTTEMQDFNRFCKVLIFAARTNKDPSAQESIKNRLGVCRFVFGVETTEDRLSAGPDSNFHKVRTYYIPVEMGWQIPLDCDPSQPTCEEF